MDTTTTLQIFDFDETIFRVPGYTSKNQVESEDLKFDTPYEFYDHPISLCENTHNIQLIGPVYEEWVQGTKDPDCKTMLITHRVVEVQPEVMQILKNRKMSFDITFFLGRKSSKAITAGIIVASLPQLKTVKVYEDSIEQIDIYQRFFEDLNKKRVYRDGLDPIELQTFIVDKSKMFKIDNVKLSEDQRIKLI